MLLVPVGVAATASPSPVPNGPRSIAVSVPPDPVTLRPGETAAVAIRVLNPSVSPVTVTVKGEGITLGNNGTTTFTGKPDPVWADRTTFPSGAITIPAQHFVDLSVVVHMPSEISPDLYYIGFLVTPVPTSNGQVVVINQIGAFLTIDVSGPRAGSLSADLTTSGFNWGPIHINSLVIGDRVDGRLTVDNTGASSLLFFGENDVTSAPFSGPPAQQRISRSLLPIRRSRWFAVTGAPAFPIDVVTLTDVVSYPNRTGTGTLEIVRTKSVLVVSPWVFVVLIVLLVLAGGWRLRVQRRRRELRSRRTALRSAA